MSALILVDWFTTLSLIFGGCCSNAITLEQLTADYPHAGSLITAFQFLLISMHGLPRNLKWTRYGPRLKPRRIPLAPYVAQVVLFYLISLLNNAAFSYQIPMSVHIIFRSGGLVISMLLGWMLGGKRYSHLQVFSVAVITCGVLLTTMSAAKSSSVSAHNIDMVLYAQGVAILTAALLLSGFLGLVQDYTYSQYGRSSDKAAVSLPSWQESMFYLHFLSLPMFFFLRGGIMSQLRAVNSSPKTTIPIVSSEIPGAYGPLLLNTVTQLVCVAGVNQLTTRVTSLTVTLVLVLRKAASLLISVWIGRGTRVDPLLLWTGSGLVLFGTVGYTLATSRAKTKPKRD